jgi:hypothetical protein
LDFKKSIGQVTGPAISDIKGKIYSSRSLNDAFLEILEDLFNMNQEFFPASIEDKETLRKHVQAYRTFRRECLTLSLSMKVMKVLAKSTSMSSIVGKPWRRPKEADQIGP